jgi:solute carrier family 25 carnitine/acylcarnitine transporter 20/29
MVGHPWDCVKIQVQTNNKLTGIASAVKYLYKVDGFKGFFRGILPPLYGSTALSAVCFGLYDQSSNFFRRYTDDEFVASFSGGTVVGVTTACFMTPFDLVKTQLQMQSGRTSLYNNELDCVRQIMRIGGTRAIFRGFFPTLVREVFGYGVYFSTYDYFHRSWGNSTLALLNAGGIAGVVS